jgi:hypothetical protein
MLGACLRVAQRMEAAEQGLETRLGRPTTPAPAMPGESHSSRSRSRRTANHKKMFLRRQIALYFALVFLPSGVVRPGQASRACKLIPIPGSLTGVVGSSSKQAWEMGDKQAEWREMTVPSPGEHQYCTSRPPLSENACQIAGVLFGSSQCTLSPATYPQM